MGKGRFELFGKEGYGGLFGKICTLYLHTTPPVACVLEI